MSTAHLSLYQGDDFVGVVSVFDSAGEAADLTGYTAKAQIRRSFADNDPTVACEIDTVITSPDVHLTIPGADTAALIGKYVWDLQLVSAAGAVTTILSGNVAVTQEVTRSAP